VGWWDEPVVECSELVSSTFVQNILHCSNEGKARQANGMYVVSAARLGSTFYCMLTIASSQNI